MGRLIGRIRALGRQGRTPWRVVALAVCVAGLAGCATDPLANQRVVAYLPDVPAGDRTPWHEPPAVTATASDAASAETLLPPVAAGADGAEVAPTQTTAADAQGPNSDQVALRQKVLRRDDRLTITLRGIPHGEEISEVVDGNGNVNLPLIGLVRIEGKTTDEAEQLVERAYIDGGFYRSINAIILAQEESFFVRGEVTRPGKYPLTGDTTLMMGLTGAGGYTDYANARKVKVIRGDKVITLNASRIEAREDEDFLIHPDDIIVVERRIIF